jgi:hypothetical protein
LVNASLEFAGREHASSKEPDIVFHGVRINRSICRAIEKRIRLRCKYDTKTRIIEPQCHGLTKDLNEVVRIVEIYPGDQYGKPVEGKLFIASKMLGLSEIAGKVFEPGPHYNPEDKGMKYIHCHL